MRTLPSFEPPQGLAPRTVQHSTSLRGLLATAAVLLVTAIGSTAHGQADAGARALAVQLFDEAEALMASGNFAAACPKYAESNRLDAQLGALLHLADCFEANGQLASAWGSFRQAEELARKREDPRAEQAHERAQKLEPRLSRLVIEIEDGVKIPGLALTRDDVPIAPAVWGVPAAVDAGTYRVEARAPGYTAWRQEVKVSGEASVVRIPIPRLVKQALPPQPNKSASASLGSPVTDRSLRIAAIAIGGLGVAALGTGGFFALTGQASYSDSKPLCNAANYCTPEGTELRKEAKRTGLIATVVGGAGLGALAAAGVLWFSAPKSTSQPSKDREARWSAAPTTGIWGVQVNHAF